MDIQEDDFIHIPSKVFYLCFFEACRQGNNDIIHFLLQCNNIEIDKILDYDDVLSEREISVDKKIGKQEKTPLLLAAESGQLETIKLLEKHQADIRLKTSKDNTALLLAAKNNHLDVVKYLIETKEININEENMYKDTALIRAANCAGLKCIKYLIDKDANVLHIDINGKSVIYNAVFSGSLDCVKAISESISEDVLKEHINHQATKTNFTALHWAAKQNYENIVEYLLSKGADPSLQDSRYKKPYDLAKNPNVKRLLFEGARVKFVSPSEKY